MLGIALPDSTAVLPCLCQRPRGPSPGLWPPSPQARGIRWGLICWGVPMEEPPIRRDSVGRCSSRAGAPTYRKPVVRRGRLLCFFAVSVLICGCVVWLLPVAGGGRPSDGAIRGRRRPLPGWRVAHSGRRGLPVLRQSGSASDRVAALGRGLAWAWSTCGLRTATFSRTTGFRTCATPAVLMVRGNRAGGAE